MKRTLFNQGTALIALAGLCVAGPTMSAPAQGTVLFRNDERGLVYQWSGELDPTPTLMGWDNEPHIQIAYAPAGTPLVPWRLNPGWDSTKEHWLSLNPGWTLGPTANMVDSGRFDGGTLSLEGVPSGTKADYVTFGWGPGDFDDATRAGSWYGFAGPFTTLTGGEGLPLVSLADSFTGMTIIGHWYIPEPSSAALLILGAGTVLALRLRGSNHRAQRTSR